MIDAIDTVMNVRPCDAELIPWLLQHSFVARRRGKVLSCCWLTAVDDTDRLQPLKQTHGYSLWSSGNRGCCAVTTGAADSSTLVGVSSRHLRSCCDRLLVAPSHAPMARCRWPRPRHLAREVIRLCLVETVLPSPEDVLLLRVALHAPPRSSR